jgi:hypothetical protein
MPHRTRLSACGTFDPHMNQSDTAENAIREKLMSYADPYLSQTLGRPRVWCPSHSKAV